MRSISIVHFFLLLIFLLAYQCASAQDYIVLTTGDTLQGEVKPMLYGVEKKVQFKGQDKEKTVYSVFKISAFYYREEIYHPVKSPYGVTFMKLKKAGYLSLYSFQLPNQTSFDGLYLARKDGTGQEVPNLSFKKYMKNFLEDCPVIVEKIDNGDLGKRDLDQIINEYNQCIEDNTVDHDEIIATQVTQERATTAWDVLEGKVRAAESLDNKATVLEMISEIKSKIAKSEKIPNFVVDGLKQYLSDDEFKVELENALKELE
jgi:hypothetical protein